MLSISEELKLDTLKILTGQEAVDAVHALNEESRRQILHALRAKRMATSELCDFLERQENQKEIKPQTVRYHLKELEKAGLIEQAGHEPVGNGSTHIMKKLWRATAENVFIATGDMDNLPERYPLDMDRLLDIVGVMKMLGFDLPDDESTQQLADDFTDRDHLANKGSEGAKKTLKEVAEIDPAVYARMYRILSVVQLKDGDYKKYWELNRSVTDRLREAYSRGVGKNPEVY